MMADLRQTSTFKFTPGSQQPRNFVFVDEQNRHRRLKVVRACDGCRKRKIKCDAANTNTWPCSACVRLKLNCHPPAFGFEDENSEIDLDSQASAVEQTPQNYSSSFPQNSHGMNAGYFPSLEHVRSVPAYTSYPTPDNGPLDLLDNEYTSTVASNQTSPSYPNLQRAQSAESESWASEPGENDLTKALGGLKISHTAVADYIVNQRSLAQENAQREDEVQIPERDASDPTIQIPAEMMPDDKKALDLFSYYFANVHPYIPVLNPVVFYAQWRANRSEISPLILEAIFACSSQMMGNVEDSNRWLALASRDEESFKDVPRLSTVQAFLLLLKAREGKPTRGYYYRSWISVVTMLAMSKDLELHKHLESHQQNQSCGASDYDCALKTRLWQALFVIELFVGGPQGRTEYSIDLDTVDFECQYLPGLPKQEVVISQQFAYLMKIARNVRRTSRVYANLRYKFPDVWALDSRMEGLNVDYHQWNSDLPVPMKMSYNVDPTPPWIPTHYIANLHAYHNLSLVMHYRPKVSAKNATAESRLHHMLVCTRAAINICLLQESILQSFGLPGLLAMQRGINFHLYSILTCIMIHLCAITAPEPKINSKAKDFLTRHMRLLERCAPSWQMVEMQTQITSLRQAFTADINKPFALREDLFLGSPGRDSLASPPLTEHNNDLDEYFQQHSTPQPSSYGNLPGTPLSTSSYLGTPAELNFASELAPASVALMQPTMAPSAPVAQSSMASQWNPDAIFTQWTAAFGLPIQQPAESAQKTPPPAATTYEQPQQNYYQFQHSPTAANMHIGNGSPVANMPSPYQQPSPAPTSMPTNAYVAPNQWQEAFWNSYPDSLKRRHAESTGLFTDSRFAKRAR